MQTLDVAAPFWIWGMSPNQSARVSGIGLGLTVCQRLVELQGGTISVSNREGGGCQFSFTIPIAVFDDE